jgi:hypothetical protein
VHTSEDSLLFYGDIEGSQSKQLGVKTSHTIARLFNGGSLDKSYWVHFNFESGSNVNVVNCGPV